VSEYDSDWRAYVSVPERRRQAARMIAKLRKGGRKVDPIAIEGRQIVRSFWGSAWCDNLEAYSDYANRLPRGRTYVRNGSVIDLQIEGGHIAALVSGSEIYEVELRVKPLAAAKWKRIRSQCAGEIDSLVELLRGTLSHGVMGIVTKKGAGLFPAPKEIRLDCSCPDWAVMCKHVAAVLYGVGARLDHAPELLFTLRGVDPGEMVGEAVDGAVAKRKPGRGRVLAEADLSAVFGVEIEVGEGAAGAKVTKARERGAGGRKKGSGKAASGKQAGKRKATKTQGKSGSGRKARKGGASVREKAAASKAGPATGATKRTKKRRPPAARLEPRDPEEDVLSPPRDVQPDFEPVQLRPPSSVVHSGLPGSPCRDQAPERSLSFPCPSELDAQPGKLRQATSSCTAERA
jgi:uncharacterized Zn finger protein